LSDLITRAWNGTPISRRTTDGYVNATTMAKASGKQWHDYWRTDRTTEYLEALSAETGIPVSSLCLTTRGGAYQGTWIHARVAVDFARWISAPFAVWMDGWFLEEIERASQVRDTRIPALPAPAEQVTAAAQGLVFIWDALESRGLADDRDRIELKRDLKVLHTALVLTTTGQLPGTSDVLSPVDRLPKFLGRSVDIEAPLTLVEWAAAYLPAETSSVVNKYDVSLGTEGHKLYKQRHNEEAPTTTHLSVKAEQGRKRLGLALFGQAKNGFACTPRMYLPRDWDLLVVALRSKGLITPDKAAEWLAECQQFRAGMDF
jgi:hypothetical protein